MYSIAPYNSIYSFTLRVGALRAVTCMMFVCFIMILTKFLLTKILEILLVDKLL